MAITERVERFVARVTGEAKSLKDWRGAVRLVHALYGRDALYFINCERFADDEEDETSAMPYEVWIGGKMVHFGVEIQHTEVLQYPDWGKMTSSYGDEIFLLW